jgi:putative aldouronate transport system substrate-binding protein
MFPQSSSPLNRRRFLALGGGAGLALAIAGCGQGAATSSNSVSGVTTALLPGTQPIGWNNVLSQVNAKLSKDLGFTLDAQFVSWTNYVSQNLLKFTAGASFDTTDEALWMNMAQLQQSGALAEIPSFAKYPNLAKTIPATLVEANQWSGKLWGVPQVSTAGRLVHFVVRQDLADKWGISSIEDYGDLERFLYTAKQKGGGGMIPFVANSTLTFEMAVPNPNGLFNEASWNDPHTIGQMFNGSDLYFIFAKDAATTGSSNPIPFWEDPGTVQAFKTIRQYYQDGIINANALNLDTATANAEFTAGGAAATDAQTDGLTSSTFLPLLLKTVPSAQIADVLPLKGGLTGTKPNQTFQAQNNVVINKNGGDLERAMALQDWVSIKENHDLLEYGIEGTDWKQVGDNKYQQLSQYTFPGYALLWRTPLELRTSLMTESEETEFSWAQDFSNFTLDPFASFIPDSTPVKQAVTQMSNVMTEYANPLYYGAVDVDSQLSKLQSAASAAGLSTLQEEMEKQANAYLKAAKK